MRVYGSLRVQSFFTFFYWARSPLVAIYRGELVEWEALNRFFRALEVWKSSART